MHEWVEDHGGSETVVDAILQEFPEADLLCLWNNSPSRYKGRRVMETMIGKSFLRGKKAAAMPFMPLQWWSTDISSYDWVVASSHLFAHHVGRRSQRGLVPVFAYIHSPARYIWETEIDTRGNAAYARIAAAVLKRVDTYRASDNIRYAANSRFVADRIRRHWGREAVVINPPVDVVRIRDQATNSNLSESETRVLATLPSEFVLGASRLIEYKQIDKVIDFGDAVGIPVVIAGDGPEREYLESYAAKNATPVTFVGRVSDAMLYQLYARALAYVFPPIEDFGIMPVEAIALRTPVIGNFVGGVAEIIEETGGGVVFDFSDYSQAEFAIRRALELDMVGASAKSDRYSVRRFQREVNEWIKSSDQSAISANLTKTRRRGISRLEAVAGRRLWR